MWTISELKQRGWVSMKRRYWLVVLVALIGAICYGGGQSLLSLGSGAGFNLNLNINHAEPVQPQYDYYVEGAEALPVLAVFGAIFAVIALIAGLLAVLITVFLRNPLEIGVRRFTLQHIDAHASLDDLLWAFGNNYLGNVKTMFLRSLYVTLWSLLFFVPGIIKSYSYRLVPYILAEHPEMESREVLETSRRLMNGHKWHTFVLDLSFIGWAILTAVTFGICGVLIQNPYQAMTNAYLFRAIAYPEPEEPFCDPLYT